MPPEATKNIQANMKDRLASLQETIKNETGLLRKVVSDVRGRVVEGKEPSLPGEAGLPGKTGGLTDEIPSFVLATIDNVQRGILKQASITRRWSKR